MSALERVLLVPYLCRKAHTPEAGRGLRVGGRGVWQLLPRFQRPAPIATSRPLGGSAAAVDLQDSGSRTTGMGLSRVRGVCTGVCITRALATHPAHLTRLAKPNRLGYAGRDGRTWDRTNAAARRCSVTLTWFLVFCRGIDGMRENASCALDDSSQPSKWSDGGHSPAALPTDKPWFA